MNEQASNKPPEVIQPFIDSLQSFREEIKILKPDADHRRALRRNSLYRAINNLRLKELPDFSNSFYLRTLPPLPELPPATKPLIDQLIERGQRLAGINPKVEMAPQKKNVTQDEYHGVIQEQLKIFNDRRGSSPTGNEALAREYNVKVVGKLHRINTRLIEWANRNRVPVDKDGTPTIFKNKVAYNTLLVNAAMVAQEIRNSKDQNRYQTLDAAEAVFLSRLVELAEDDNKPPLPIRTPATPLPRVSESNTPPIRQAWELDVITPNDIQTMSNAAERQKIVQNTARFWGDMYPGGMGMEKFVNIDMPGYTHSTNPADLDVAIRKQLEIFSEERRIQFRGQPTPDVIRKRNKYEEGVILSLLELNEQMVSWAKGKGYTLKEGKPEQIADLNNYDTLMLTAAKEIQKARIQLSIDEAKGRIKDIKLMLGYKLGYSYTARKAANP